MKLDGVILTLRILLGKEKQGRKFIYILERKNSQKLQMRWENVCVGKRLFLMSKFWRKVQQQLLTLIQYVLLRFCC